MEEQNIKTRVVGVDISMERTTYAIVDVRGNIIAENYIMTKDYPSVNDFVTRLSEGIVELVEANGGYETVRSVGISSPSGNKLTGCIEMAPNMQWKGVIPMAALLRDQLGLAVGLANDAHTSAMGEKVYGSAHGMNDFLVVKIGVGLGSCFYSNGREHLGYGGLAGEFGHACIVDHGRRCSCGKDGCLEAYTAENGIILTAQEVMAESDEPSLMRSLERLSPKTIQECCEQGDKLAIEVYRRTGYMLGLGLSTYAATINPEAIILTGGISHAGKWLVDPLYESFEEHLLENMRGKVKILISKLDDRERDVLGASALAWEVPEYSLFK